MGTVSHHQERSQHFLGAARRGISGGDYHYAAVALSRSAGHSVTAAAEKSGFPYRSQRRLINFLIDVVCTRRVPLAHLRLFGGSTIFRMRSRAQTRRRPAASSDRIIVAWLNWSLTWTTSLTRTTTRMTPIAGSPATPQPRRLTRRRERCRRLRVMPACAKLT